VNDSNDKNPIIYTKLIIVVSCFDIVSLLSYYLHMYYPQCIVFSLYNVYVYM